MRVDDQWWTLLHYAAMAPSGHNTQPWRFRIAGRICELYADRSRSLPVVDPQGRELAISCGAALLNLRVAIAHFGLSCRTQILPEPGNSDLLARVELTDEAAPVSSGGEALFDAIAERRTNRMPFDSEPLTGELIEELEAAARAEGAWLIPLRADADRRRVAELIAEGDLLQAGDRAVRREMADWVRDNNSGKRDGLRGYSFGHGRLASMVAPLYIRYGHWGEGQAASDRELALTAPLLALLGTDGDEIGGWIRAGQALGRVLLTAQSHRVSASFFNQPVEVPDLRERLRAISAASGYPQLCLRFGRGREVPPSPRRPLEEMVESV